MRCSEERKREVRNVLLVDDESMVRIGVKTCVDWQKLDIGNVFEAANGSEALEIVRNNQIDIIITDLKMSVMDGFAMLDELKSMLGKPEVIVMSCYNDYDNMRRAMTCGVKDFLFKPQMYPEDIEEAVRKVQKEMAKTRIPDERSGKKRDVLSGALQFIDSHLADPDLCQDMVAEYTGLSVSYFCRLFKNEMGISYSNYITKKRIELAEQLYRTTDMKVYEIAGKVGYTNEKYFARLYKEQTGHSMKNLIKKGKKE